MKWLAVAVLLVLVAPLGAAAQTSGILDTEIEVESFGSGWAVDIRESTGTSQNPWRKHQAFLGPNGSRVLIHTFDIGESITDRSAGWALLQRSLSDYVGQHALPAEFSSDFGSVDDTGVPDGVADAMRSEYVDIYGQPLGYGIYASAHTKVAILIVVEGTVNGLTGVAATDYVAGLYFAALSAE